MLSLTRLLLAATSILPGALSAPQDYYERLIQNNTEGHLEARQGYYFSFWQEGNGNFRCNSGNGGQYSATWSGQGGFVCGKGWRGGGGR